MLVLRATCEVHQGIGNTAALQNGIRSVQLCVRFLYNARPKHICITTRSKDE